MEGLVAGLQINDGWEIISLCCVARSLEFSPLILVIDADDDPRVLLAAIKVSYWEKFNFDTGCFEI